MPKLDPKSSKPSVERLPKEVTDKAKENFEKEGKTTKVKKETVAEVKTTEKKEIVSEAILSEARQRGQVYIEKGVTKNMGDYNSSRVTVGVTLPLDPTPEEIDNVQKTIDIINPIIDSELEKQVDALIS